MSNETHSGCCGGGHHDHDHDHEHGGGCGSSACEGCSCSTPRTGAEGNLREIAITYAQSDFLEKLSQSPYLPVARFTLITSASDDILSTALAPVYLEETTATMDQIKEMGRVIEQLAELELLTIDYESPLLKADYTVYEQSEAFDHLKATVDESAKSEDAVFNGCRIDVGTIALTQLGQVVIDQLSFS